MQFEITRTSLWDNERPIDGAKQIEVDRIEVRTLSTPDEFDERFSLREGAWLSKGKDHKINERGYIQRIHPNDEKVWVIEISSLENLIEFHKENGPLILGLGMWSRKPQIEIYDDYRE